MSAFIAKLSQAWEKNDSLLCIGLDPDIERFPRHIAAEASPIFQFNKAIVDATGDLVCAYKPQFAHYAAYEAEDQLERTIEYIHRTRPDVAVILDAKRGDVGNTAERYAIEAFERYAADAVTVNPYLGGDALEPFLRHADKGVVILCRTSNPGAGEVQDLVVGGRKLYQVVAQLAAARWNAHGNCLLVVGATCPRELAEVRALVGGYDFQISKFNRAIQSRRHRGPARLRRFGQAYRGQPDRASAHPREASSRRAACVRPSPRFLRGCRHFRSRADRVRVRPSSVSCCDT